MSEPAAPEPSAMPDDEPRPPFPGAVGAYSISPVPGYTPEIGRLVGMLEHARETTLNNVRGLTVSQLDHRHDDRSNSIGCLLAHVAAVEHIYQIATFERREPDAAEQERWGAALDLGEPAWSSIRGRSLESYLADLAEVRERTRTAFFRLQDPWLEERETFPGGQIVNRFWQWYHVCEDEISHRGQIRWLRARLLR